MCDLSVRLRRQFSFPGMSSKRNGRHHDYGSYRRQRRDRRHLKWSFNDKVKRSLMRYISELWPAKFSVLPRPFKRIGPIRLRYCKRIGRYPLVSIVSVSADIPSVDPGSNSVESSFFFLFFSRQNRILSRKQILPYIE